MMAKVSQSKSDLRNHVREQLGFMIKSCKAYDDGDLSEAKRVATTIRVLLHDTKHSKSLFGQLSLKDIGFLNTAVPIDEEVKHATLGLIQTVISVGDDLQLSGQHKPLLSHRPRDWPPARKRFFPEWWNQTVLTDIQGRRFSRRLLVMAVANTDGGAHIDPELDSGYAALSRQNSIGYAVENPDGKFVEIDKSELASIRQIAHEIVVSVAARYPDLMPTNLPYDVT